MKAVIYARYSSNKQTEQSIEGQLRVCKEYAERNSLLIIKEYIDRETTGKKDNRPAFQQMLDDSKSKEFDAIIVYKLDRFARNNYHSVVHEHNLNKQGVRLLSATEGITDSPEGKVMKALFYAMAEMYSDDLSQKVKRGNRENLLKGLWTGGNVLYGYRVENKKVYVDEPKAEIVRYIFKEYACGTTKKQIVENLNKRGVLTASNKPFTTNCLQDNLKNKKYIGIVEINGETYDNIFPPIIEKKIFDAVQLMLERRKGAKAMGKAKAEFLLTGKAFCGLCGGSFIGASGFSRTKNKHSYYTCVKRNKHKSCTKPNEQKDHIENEVIRQTIEWVLNPKRLEIIAKLLEQAHKKEVSEIKINDFTNQIKAIDNEIQKLVNALINAQSEIVISTINENAKSLEIQRKDLDKELTQLKLARAIKHTKQDFIDYLRWFMKGDVMSLEYKKKLINTLVNSVWVFDKMVIVFYNIASRKPLTIDELKDALKENNIEYESLVDGSYTMSFGDP